MSNRMDRAAARAGARALVSQMTPEEQASQLSYISPAIERLGVPAYNWWNEALHGVARAGTATMFPQAIGLAAMFDDGFLRRVADCISTEARAKYNMQSKANDRAIYKGLTFWSPNVNIFRDPRWGRGHETYGEDPYLTSRLGVAFIEGLQGGGEHIKAAACAKHYAVHSGPEKLRHEFDAEVSEKDLWETYLPAFEACVTEAGVEAVMGAYNRTDGEPCCGSYRLIRDVLRGKWGFGGHFVSDCGAINDFNAGHKITATPVDSAALAIDAGCDLNCGDTYLQLMIAYNEGKVTAEHIRLACERLYTTRFMLGMFGECEYDSIPYSVVDCDAHAALAKEAAVKSYVLLKNDGLLPLDAAKIKTVAVIGPNADSRAALRGNYYGTASRNVTVLEGVRELAGANGIRVLYSQGSKLSREWIEGLETIDGRVAEAEAMARLADVVILCVGLDESLEGEEGGGDFAGDKSDIELPEAQRYLIERVTALGKPTVLVSMTGSAVNLAYAHEHCGAILQAWYPGELGGTAVADVLFGNATPSGKLPVTFYADLREVPDFTDYSMANRTYRYFDGHVLYPFGYGLTYGRLELLGMRFAEGPTPDGARVRVKLANRSERRVEDVVQLYIKNTSSPYAPRNHSLCKFGRVALDPGQELEVEYDLDRRALEVVNEKGERALAGGHYILYAGTSQPDARSLQLGAPAPVELEFEV